MLALVLVRPGRFYRVEVAENLFGEYSVLREWGRAGRRARPLVAWFSNLREAVVAAERWGKGAERRGFIKEHRV
ncbi:MAG: WGR domain-containing protein [Gemmobacter sp.]|jgi:predicted DNA-binding WGR domain protein|nr:WGR domain-containing protein [Gemmobacter sp.]